MFIERATRPNHERKLSIPEKDIKKAQAMLRDPQITKTEVAKHFGVSRVTLNSSLNKS
ncbi:helix-turn-helix domain-containing protein [Acinetobacter geminorum]|uniref:helix-turn-helix domain-containing protein n=1 Tax=Acinetobacter geminorum TaxID=2730922 RepID=UPI0034CDACCA